MSTSDKRYAFVALDEGMFIKTVARFPFLF